MDRRQMLVQRTREYMTDRLTDVLHMVRQDRQEMRGWQEPPHLRATLRRTAREGAPTPASETTEASQLRLMEQEFGRNAGEPDRGQQREALGLLLEAGANRWNASAAMPPTSRPKNSTASRPSCCSTRGRP